MTYAELTSLINTNLTRVGNNRVSAAEIKQVCQALLDFAAAIDNTDAIPTWTAVLTFQTDGTGAGKYCTHPDANGKKRIFETKIANNTGNEPPTDPNLTEDAFWEEISASAGSAIHEWSPGLHGVGLVTVYHNHSSDGRGLYILLEPVRPFNSTDIEAEILAGKWDRLNIENLQKTLARGNSAGDQRIRELADPVDPQDADTKAAREAAVTALETSLRANVPVAGDNLEKLYNLIVGVGQFAGNHDASAGALPVSGTGPGGTIDKGDYWIVTDGGVIAGIDGADDLQANDVIYAKQAGANLPAHFFGVNSNVDLATPTVLGLVKLVQGLTGVGLLDEVISTAGLKTLLDLKADRSIVDSLQADIYQGSIDATIVSDIYEPVNKTISDWQYTTSIFSGWGFPIGRPQNFDGIKIRLRARSAAISSIRIGLFIHSETGTKLIDQTIPVSIDAFAEKEITFFLGTVENTAADPLFFVFLCNQLVDFFGTTTNPVFAVPEYGQTAYKTNGVTSSFGLQDVSAGVQPNAWFQVGISGTGITEAKYTTAQEMVLDTVKPVAEVLIPSVLYATEGVEMNIFWESVIFSERALSDLQIDVTCSKGKQYDKYWRYTPLASDAGNTTFAIDVKYQGKVLVSKVSTLYTSSAANAGSKSLKVICVGDSTTAGGNYVSIINSDYSALNQPTITFLGTQGAAPNQHEGRGGWTFNDYATAGRTFHKFIVSGITTAPALGAIYSNNGSNFTVREVNITTGSGYISCEKSGTNGPLVSGTLTKVSGVGDASIAYSSFSTLSGNPFWNDATLALDIQDYLTANGFTLTASDLITFHLGINDVFSSVNESLLTSIKIHLNNLIAAFRTAVPNIKIGVCLTIPPSISQDAFAENYSNAQTLGNYLINYKQLVSALLSEFDGEARRTDSVYVIGLNHCLDRVNGFPTSVVNASARSTEQVTRYTNGVHPNTSGYNQMGDALYSFIRNIV